MDAQIELLWSTGMSKEEIALQLGVPEDYVQESLDRQQLTD